MFVKSCNVSSTLVESDLDRLCFCSDDFVRLSSRRQNLSLLRLQHDSVREGSLHRPSSFSGSHSLQHQHIQVCLILQETLVL